MRRLTLALVVLLAALTSFAQAAPLHVGVSGKRVEKAQWRLSGANHFRPRVHTYHGKIDGRYGVRTARATRQAKYLLGYPIQSLNGVYGWRLRALLSGHRRLSPLSSERRQRRLKAIRQPHLGIVAQGPSCRGYYAPQPYVLAFARVVAARYGHPLVCVSGYRPGSRVYGTGRVSQHSTRQAADLGTPTYAMNTAVGHAALEAAGLSPARASAYSSFAGWQAGINILFHTYIGGNHFNHVHVGLTHWPPTTRSFALAAPAARVGLNAEGPGAWNVVYRRGLSAPLGSGLGYAIIDFKRELAYAGFGDQLDLAVPLFGVYAERETRAFQQASGLVVDGVLGPRTALALLRSRALAVETRYGLPAHQLASQKTWESANDLNAIGPDGQDRGPLQVRLSSHPDVTLAQAINPAFIFAWAAQHQSANYSTLHDWDAVLCAWNAGYSLAAKWLAAGKPAAGGPVNANGLDLFTTCSNYVKRVRASAW